MNLKVKLSAYAVLLILAAWCAWNFHRSYVAVTRETAEAATNDTMAVSTNNPAPDTNAVATTNADTNQSNPAISNVITTGTNQDTNAVAAAPATNSPAPPPLTSPQRHSAQGTMIAYLAAFVGTIIGLGLLIAHDVTQYVGNAAVDALLDDKGEGMRDPEYEKAEQTWANGKHLESIQMMRDFLKKNPREQYAALRIAEIYEKDLNNPVAAALEYEEVLKKKLPAERWGWAAVHLCNLYSKLGQQDKQRALLQRIVDEYPKTAAAKKARNRLGLPEPEEAPLTKDSTEPAGEPTARRAPTMAEEEMEPEAPPPPKSNLPPGFRPKD